MLSPTPIVSLLFLVPAFVVWRAILFRNALKAVGHTPGLRVLTGTTNIFAAILPYSRWTPGLLANWKYRKTSFMNHTHEIISMVSLMYTEPIFMIGSVAALKKLLSHEAELEKPARQTTAVTIWGPNVFAANGDLWKRYRRIVGPAFTTKTYEYVIEESTNAYNEMVSSLGWRDKRESYIADVNTLTMRFALVIISRCGFGMSLPWTDISISEKGGMDSDLNNMSMAEALNVVSEQVIAKLALPSWVYRLPIKRFKRIDAAYKQVAAVIDTLITQKIEEVSADGYDVQSEKGDVFTRLVHAHVNGEGSAKLTLDRDELIGNVFIMLFAGHETTGRTLSATLAYLAIYQDEQEKAIEEINRCLPDGRDMRLEDLPKLKHTLACFYEASRIFPGAQTLLRSVHTGFSLPVTRPHETSIQFNPGSLVFIDMIGIHHDPVTYPSPSTFRPSRWYDTNDRDLTTFGVGQRACVGKRFAQTEAAAFLVAILREWKIDIVAQNNGRGYESGKALDNEHSQNIIRKEYEERVMSRRAPFGLGFGVGKVELKVTRRRG